MVTCFVRGYLIREEEWFVVFFVVVDIIIIIMNLINNASLESNDSKFANFRE